MIPTAVAVAVASVEVMEVAAEVTEAVVVPADMGVVAEATVVVVPGAASVEASVEAMAVVALGDGDKRTASFVFSSSSLLPSSFFNECS